MRQWCKSQVTNPLHSSNAEYQVAESNGCQFYSRDRQQNRNLLSGESSPISRTYMTSDDAQSTVLTKWHFPKRLFQIINCHIPRTNIVSCTISAIYDTSDFPTNERHFLQIEYGVLSNNQTFVRRSCDDRRCRSCSSDFRVGLRRQCHTFQCDLCNWNRYSILITLFVFLW